jgi:heme/copper-type cytochrome/quinol oxidase subunit 2
MSLFNRKVILPVDIVITIAINIVVVVLGHYLVMAWGLRGANNQRPSLGTTCL